MKLFILAIVIAFLCMIVKQYRPEYALVCQLCGVIAIILYAVSTVGEIFSSLNDMILSSGLDMSFVEILFKALAVSVLTDLSSSVCSDSGNNTLSKAVDMLGKTVIIVLALPILKKLMEAAIGFIG